MTHQRIGQILMQDGHCDRETLMHAWEQKVLFGDRLGTNLLAIAALNEQTLAEALGKQAGVHAAWGAVIAVNATARDLLSPLIAKRRKIVGHHVERACFYYLTTDPLNVAIVSEVAAATRLQPVPVVVCEVRMWELQNEHYGVAVGMRPIDLHDPALLLRNAQEESLAPIELQEELTSEDDFYALYQGKAGQGISNAASDFAELEPTELEPKELEPKELEPTELEPTELEPMALEAAALLEADSLHLRTITGALVVPTFDDEQRAHKMDEASEAKGSTVRGAAAADSAFTELTPIEIAASMAIEPATEKLGPIKETSFEPLIAASMANTQKATEKSDVTEVEPITEALMELAPLAPLSGADITGKFSKPTLPAKTASETLADPLPLTGPSYSSTRLSVNFDDSPLTFTEATAALEQVKGRSEIARIVLRFAVGRFVRAALLTVHPKNILGWEGIGEGVTTESLAAFRLPRSQKSVFALVAESRAHYIGPLQRWPGNGVWVKQTGRILPQSVAVFPVLVRGQVVNLFYGDKGHGQHASSDVGELLILAQKISASYESLIHQ